MSLSAPRNPKVFVVDDDEQMRTSLVALLDVLGFEAKAFSTPGSFHRFYRRDMPGCLLLDIRMPRQNGLDLYEQLLREEKKLPVIFLTAHADVSTAIAAMKTGAIEFLEKPYQRDALVELVRKAIALDADWRTSDARFAEVAERVAKLTASQRETLELIRAGETNKSIAARLAITERAVEMRRSTIMRKLDVRTAAEVIDIAATHRILSELRGATTHRLTM
jgi:FixJ family two-component response regulator